MQTKVKKSLSQNKPGVNLPQLLDTRHNIKCPHCTDGTFTDYLSPGITHQEPCAGCGGDNEVMDGVGRGQDGWECWKDGELYTTDTEAQAIMTYNTAQVFTPDMELPF